MDKQLIKASDALSWAICRRRAWYEHNPPEKVADDDPFDELIRDEGVAHEARYMASIGDYVEAIDEKHTKLLMAQGADRIYQGVITNEALGVVCKPDLLTLVDGDYRPEDIKLAGDMESKKGVRAQVGTYSIVLGTSVPGRILLSKGEEYELTESDLRLAKEFLTDMQGMLSDDKPPPAHFVASKCKGCPFRPTCIPAFEKADEITRNYFIDARAVDRLSTQGIRTLSELADKEPSDIEPVPWLKKVELRRKAVLQARSLREGKVIQIGVPAMPEGTPIHFDIETWPFGAEGEGTVYLWGFLVPPFGPGNYEYIWGGMTPEEDEAAWLTFLAQVDRYRAQYPNPYLVHYTTFEKTQVRRYAKRYQMEDDQTVEWLLNNDDSCHDIKKTVSDNLILPVVGYGLKDICKNESLVNFQWEVEGSGSQWSVVRYRDWMREKDAGKREAIKLELLSYNRDDVRGTHAVQVWLGNFVSHASAA